MSEKISPNKASNGLEQYAPFLVTYGPSIFSLVVIYLSLFYGWHYLSRKITAAKHLRKTSLPGRGPLLQTRPLSQADEDGYAFQDKAAEEVVGEQDDDLEEEGKYAPIPYRPITYPSEDVLERSRSFYRMLDRRRTVRFFSDKPVSLEVVKNLIRTAGTSPSGAHTEPWTYVVVAGAELKSYIRQIIETEEMINYEKRMGDQWKRALKALNTNWQKPYLETAPYLVVVFKQSYSHRPNGSRKNHYYSELSVSISVGILLAAIQNAGLVTLTSTPMNAGPQLRKLLNRPENEKVIMLLPIGYAANDATVPDIRRKPLEEIMIVEN